MLYLAFIYFFAWYYLVLHNTVNSWKQELIGLIVLSPRCLTQGFAHVDPRYTFELNALFWVFKSVVFSVKSPRQTEIIVHVNPVGWNWYMAMVSSGWYSLSG